MAITVTLRWYFPIGANLDQPPTSEPAIDVGDLDGDGVLDPSPVAFNGSNYNPDTMETVRVEVVVTNPVGQDATEVTYFLTEDGTNFFFLGVGPFTLPSGKSNAVTFDTFIDRQTNQFVVPLLEQFRVDYKYGGVAQPSAFSDDVTPQNPYLAGATDQTIVTADGLELHGTVFNDADANSAFDSGEVGVANVQVKIYADTGSTAGAFDGADAFLATTTTDANGEYHFRGLAPGDYIVQVAPVNFTTGKPLENLAVSSPGTIDPDDNVDNDDNGAPSAGNGVVSLPIRLDYNQEPLDLIGPHIERVSVTSTGAEITANSFDPSISGTGRYVAFSSNGLNLVAGQVDTNGNIDVFVFDREFGTVRLVSGIAGSTTTTGNNESAAPAISADGNFVVFASYAINLVAGQSDTNNGSDIFVFDRVNGTTRLVSGVQGDTAETADNRSVLPSISPEGRFIAFQSNATNVVATDTNGADDIFIFDRTTGTTSLISFVNGSATVQADGDSFNPSISSNVFGRGPLVAFESNATNLIGAGNDTNGFSDIFVRDTDIVNETSRVSVGVGNVQSDGDSLNASISFDARFVAFESDASNLVTGDITIGLGGFRDVFVAEIDSSGNTIAIERVSVASDGTAGNGNSTGPAISSDGRYVTFQSDASNLVANDNNGVSDIFVHDLVTHTTRRLSVDDAGNEATGPVGSFSPTVSADGRIVAFNGDASNLVPSDGNNAFDVFARTVLAGKDINTTLDFGFIDNAPPVVDATSGLGTEDQPARIEIALSGADPDGDTITVFTIEAVSANGQIFDAASGGALLTAGSTVTATGTGPYTATVYFLPNADWNGATSFTYSAFDGAQSGTAATASITVDPVADIADDTASTNEGAAVDILVQANDAFANPNHAITSTTDGSNGTVTINDNSTVGDTTDDFVVYTPNLNFIGSDSFTYTVTSGGVTETATVNVTVNGIQDDQVSAVEEAGILVNAANGVLANDSDTNGPLTVVEGLFLTSGGGQVYFFEDGSYGYVSAAGFSGTDTVQYTALDSSNAIAGTGTLTIDVTAVAREPFISVGSQLSERHVVDAGFTFFGNGIHTGAFTPVVLTSGGYVVTIDYLDQANGSINRVQTYDANHNLVGTFDPGTRIFGLKTVALTNGNYALGWDTVDQSTSERTSHVQLFDAAGTSLAGPIALDVPGTTDVLSKIAALPGGGFVALQFDNQQLYAHSISAAGVPESQSFAIGLSNGTKPSLTGLPDGEIVVAQLVSGNEVHVQRYDAHGNPIGSEILPPSDGNTIDPASMSVTVMPSGGFAVSWVSELGAETATGVPARSHVQLVDANGNLVGTQSTTDLEFTTLYGSLHPTVVPLANGGFVVHWIGIRVNNDFADEIQAYDASGNAVGSPIDFSSQTAFGTTRPHAFALPAGGFAVGVQGANPPDHNLRIYDDNGNHVGDVRMEGTVDGYSQLFLVNRPGGDTLVLYHHESDSQTDPTSRDTIQTIKFDTPVPVVQTGVTFDEDTTGTIPVVVSIPDPDGSEIVQSIDITGVPTGWTLTDPTDPGATVALNGSIWTVSGGNVGLGGEIDLALTAPANVSGSASLTFTAHTIDNVNGDLIQSFAAPFSVTINAINDAPVLTGIGPGHATSTEQVFAVLDSAAAVSDVELDQRNSGAGDYAGAFFYVTRASLDDAFGFDTVGATFTVSASLLDPDIGDLLAGGLKFAEFNNTGNTGSVTFTSTETAATTALVNDVLSRLTYANQNDNPPASITLTYVFSDGNGANPTQGDGGDKADTQFLDVDITATNDAPTVDLNGSVAGSDFQANYIPAGAAVSIAAADSGVSDPDSNITSAVITLTNKQAGDALTINGALPGGISSSIVENANTITVTLSNAATPAQYSAAIRQIEFSNGTASPNLLNRDITVVANDATDVSNTAYTTVVFNVPPTVPVDGTPPDGGSVAEGATAGTLVGIDADATDPDGVPVTAVTFSLTANPGGFFQIDATSGVVSVSAAGAAGIDFENTAPGHSFTITVQAQDAQGGTSTQDFTIDVNNVAPPQPVDAVAPPGGSVAEGAVNGTTVGVTASATDVNGGAVTYAITAGNVDGAFAIGLNSGVITVADSTKVDFESSGGSRTLTVQASDGTLTSVTQNFAIAVTDAAPSVPTDGNASANSVSEGAANGALVGITAASTDVNGGNVTFSLFDNAGGRFAIGLNTGVVTVANASLLNFESATSHDIVVRASDPSGAFNDQTFAIAVTNVPPVATADSRSVAEDQTLTVAAPGVLGNDSDVHGGAITAVLDTGPASATAFTLNSDGSFSYTPNANFNGSDSFTYHAFDGTAAGNIVAVSLTVTPVNDPPIANDDSLSSIAEDSGVRTIAFSALTGNDLKGAMNEGGQTLTVSAVSNPVGGTVAIVGGAVEFTPTANFNGAASFDYTVRDNGLTNGVADFKTDVGQATFAITPVNDAPVNTVPVAQTTVGGGRVFSSANGNAISVADIDAAGGSETVMLDALHGTLTLASTAGLTVSGNASGHVQLAGTLANINAALDGLAYQATSSAFPTDTLTIASNDNGNSGAGGALSDQDTVLLSLNRPPVAANDASALIWHIAKTGNVLANDSDPDTGDSLAVAQFAFGATSAVAGGALAGTYGTLTVSADGTFKYIATRGNLTVGQSASDHFSYTVSDSHGASAAASLDFSVTDTTLSELIGTQTSHLGGFNGELVRLYDTAFDRVADEAGLIGWVNTLKAGLPLSQVANAFAGSGEFLSKFGALNNHDFVDQIYHNALSRDADDDPGSAGWINALNQGLDRGSVLLAISDSAEHAADTQVSPLTDGFAPNENASAVGRLYYGLLDRAPDAGGLFSFATAVENGTPLKQVAQVMISSDEFNFRFPALSNHDFVDHIYQDGLGRDVDNDASGQSWIDALNLGAARADIAVAIAESPEAHSHLDPFLEKGYLLA